MFAFRGTAGVHYPQKRMVQPGIHTYNKAKQRKKGEQKKENDNTIFLRNVDAIFLQKCIYVLYLIDIF